MVYRVSYQRSLLPPGSKPLRSSGLKRISSFPCILSCFTHPLSPPSIEIFDRRIQYLGHILRHPDCPESHIIFNPSRTLCTINSPFRGEPLGRIGLSSPWPKPSISSESIEAHLQIQVHFSLYFTLISLLLNSFVSSTDMINWYHTTQQLHALLPVAEENCGNILPLKIDKSHPHSNLTL